VGSTCLAIVKFVQGALIAYFHSNMTAKSYQKWIIFVELLAS